MYIIARVMFIFMYKSLLKGGEGTILDNKNTAQQADSLQHPPLPNKNGQENVSRETYSGKKEKQQQKKQSRTQRKQQEIAEVRKKGGIAEKDPAMLENPTLKELYAGFRNNELTVVESLFNALYLWCNDNYYSSGVDVKNKYKNIYAHPSAWFANTSQMWKHNKWSFAVRIMEFVPTCSRLSQKIKQKKRKAQNRLLKAFEYSHRSSAKALVLLISIASIAGTAALITAWTVEARELKKQPALQVYIDGQYIGDIASVSDVKTAKTALEHSLSVSYGKTFRMNCGITYKPTTADSGDLLTGAKISRALSDKVHEEMSYGYGLYVYDLLVAVSPNRAWLEDSINESLYAKLSTQQINDDSIEKVSYYNFIVREGRYPNTMFLTQDEIKSMFSSQETDNNSSGKTKNDADSNTYLNVSEKATLLAGSSPGVSTEGTLQEQQANHQISVETVITKSETVNESIPYSTEYVYDDKLAENKKEVSNKGKNGLRTAVYLVDYVQDRELSRYLLNQTVISEPQNEIIVQGTRPLTEEEKRVMSTGTYIYPSSGEISSVYGWRTLGGYNEFHKGLDIRSDKGLELVASDGGTVIQASDKKNGYGLCVMIQHDDGTITRYAHCSKLYVKEGQKVGQGDYIADMGNSGRATGIHIHFEVLKNGITQNPFNYLEPR